jgi:peptide/nickel transport system substrate-binding protein
MEVDVIGSKRRGAGLLALALSLGLVAAACGSDNNTEKSTGTTAGASATSQGSTTSVNVPSGGTLTLGAEQEADCADWISSCAGSSWGAWTMEFQTMPRSFDFVKDGDSWKYQVSSLLAEEPKLVTSPKQVVTYKISPKAVWSDGQPITSSDYKYTWDQIKNGTDIYDRTGYGDIESVDDSAPGTAVVTFAKPYAKWRALFGGQYGIYPSHLLQGKDRNGEMKDGYTWSGGPWKIEKWDKGVSVTLLPNDKYWGDKPKLDRVVFKFITDTAAEFQAFKAGEVQGIYPQPQIATIDAIKAGGLDATQIVSTNTANFESLWLNNSKAPLDSKAVRQALAYSLDRDAIVKALFGGVDVNEALQSLQAPILSRFSDTEAFGGYKKDLDKVKNLMTGDGWAKGGDGIWAKGGQRATIVIKSTQGNKRRELTEQVLQQQLKEAGFELTIANEKSGDLFGSTLPKGDYQMALYAQVNTDLDPSSCNIFCSKNIPTEANGNSGNNWTRTSDPEIDKQLEQVDSNLDEDARQKAGKAADKVLADIATSIPLDPLPNISLISKKVVGPVEDNPITSVFGNMNHRGLQQ